MPTPYVKQTWIDGVAGATPISAARLTYIEDGIENATVEDGTLLQTADYELGGPATPELIGSLTGGNLTAPRGLWVNEAERLAYVACSGKFVVVDWADPTNPLEIGSCSDPISLFASREVQVSGQTAYVAADNEEGVGSVVVIDVSNPFNPVILSKITSAELDSAHAIELAGDRVYVAASTANLLVIYDVSVRGGTPRHVTSIAMPQPSRVVVDGSKVYCSNSIAAADPNGGGLNILDLDTMVVTSIRSSLLNGARGMVKRGRYVFLACTPLDKIAVVDLLAGAHVPAADFPISDGPREMRSVGNLLVVTLANDDAVAVIDASDPLNMLLVGRATDPIITDSNGLRVIGRHADGLAFATGANPSPAGLGIFRVPWPQQGNNVYQASVVESGHIGAYRMLSRDITTTNLVTSSIQHKGTLIGFNGRTPRLALIELATAPNLAQWVTFLRDFLLSRGDIAYGGEALSGLGDEGSGVTTPHTADLDVGVTWAVRLKLRHDTWAAPASTRAILSLADSTALTAYEIRHNTLGEFELLSTPQGGVAASSHRWNTFTPAPGETVDVAILVDQSGADRRGRFYTSVDDGDNWTLEDTTTVNAVNSTPVAVTDVFRLGGRLSAMSSEWDGEILLAEIRDGDLASAPVLTFDPTTVAAGSDPSFVMDGRTWTLVGNGAISAPASTVDNFVEFVADPDVQVATMNDLAAIGAGPIDSTPTDLDIVNTAAETTIYSVTIPGGTMSTNRAIRMEIFGDFLNNSGGNVSEVVRVKFGGTTVLDAATANIATGASDRGLKIQVTLWNRDATNAQIGFVEVVYGGLGNPTTGETGFSNAVGLVGLAESITATIDTTVNKVLEVTIQHPSAAATISARRRAALTRLL